MKTNKPKLEYTTDYSLFEMHNLNRKLHDDPVLEASMAKYGFWPSEPIACKHNGGNTLKIVKGHHRFNTAKKLGIGVYYIVDDTPCTIFEREGSGKVLWNGNDFLYAYVCDKNKDCTTLYNFMKKHGIAIGAAASLVGGETAGSGNMVRKVKAGAFKVGDLTHANAVTEVTDFCRDSGFPFATSTSFVTAVSMVLKVQDYDHARMMAALAKHGHKMKRRSTRNDYLAELEGVYNGGRVNRVPLAFQALEASKERHQTFGGRHKPK